MFFHAYLLVSPSVGHLRALPLTFDVDASSDISLTTAVLFPFPFYIVGRTIMLPLALHTALALLGSILIFPSTISAQFTSRLQDVTSTVSRALAHHRDLLKATPGTPEFFRKDRHAQRAHKIMRRNSCPTGRIRSVIKERSDFRPFRAR